MSEKYDGAEATQMLALAREALDRGHNADARVLAARELVQAVGEVAKAAGYNVDGGREAVGIRLPGGAGAFVSEDNGRVLVGKIAQQAQPRPVPLDYDPVHGILVGKDEDRFRHPEPGAPRKRRSAVAVVVEAMLDAIRT